MKFELKPFSRKMCESAQGVSSEELLNISGAKLGMQPGERSYDAGKKVVGRKCHLLVDTLGLSPTICGNPVNLRLNFAPFAFPQPCSIAGMNSPGTTTLFLDIGGVLLTNGWDTALHKQTAEHFQVDYAEMDHRHRVTYDAYEEGKMSLETYLRQIIFFEPRSFTAADVQNYILEQAKPYQDTIDLVHRLKVVYGLKIAVVSNEGREIAEDRIARFHLKDFVDFFIVSAFVHFRKPDLDIYRMALDVAHVQPQQVAYIEDRPLLCEVAAELGIHSVLNRSSAETREILAGLGLAL
jgi:putative hydrolase of the HAD superfamily